MDFNYRPSLQNMCAIRIASELLKESDIAKLVAEEPKPRHSLNTYRVRHEYWKNVENKVMENLTKCPTKLKKSVAKFIKPLYYEAYSWCFDCWYIGKSFEFLVRNNLLFWKTDGTINETQSAAEIARCKDIDLNSRFIIACSYFLQDEVFALWNQLGGKKCGTNIREKEIFPRGSNMAVRFWVKFMEESAGVTWRQMASEYFKEATFNRQDIPISISHFYQYLPTDVRSRYVRHLISKIRHDNDIRLCLMQMDERELSDLFKTNCTYILLLVLKWPFQLLFKDLAQQSWSRMGVSGFCSILSHILRIKIVRDLEGFETLYIFREIWNISPNSFKEEVKAKEKFFNLIQSVLGYNDENVLSLGELIEKYYCSLDTWDESLGIAYGINISW